MMKVFVCYEENSHELAMECGAITELTVFSTAEQALKWFKKRIFQGVYDGFFMDIEDEAVTEKNNLYISNLKKRIDEGFASLTMFRDHQENWNESFTICVCAEEVKNYIR